MARDSFVPPDASGNTVAGVVRMIVPSQVLEGEREVMVWIPEAALQGPAALLVLLDGQNRFLDAPTGVDWRPNEIPLQKTGAMPCALIAEVCHPGEDPVTGKDFRKHDLSPELEGATFARFLVDELVPALSRQFPVSREPSQRVLGGAALGALLSFHVALHHPGVFGKFACLSTSFEDVSEQLPSRAGQLLALEKISNLPDGIKMLFDFGDTGLDECYEPYHAELASLLRSKGWREGRQFTIRKIPGGTHEDHSWRPRLAEALRFLFANQQP